MTQYAMELHDYVKSDRDLAFEMGEYLLHAVPFGMTFFNAEDVGMERVGLDSIQKEAVQRFMAQHFNMWAESWMWPIVRQLAYRAGVIGQYPEEMPDSNAAKAARGEKQW